MSEPTDRLLTPAADQRQDVRGWARGAFGFIRGGLVFFFVPVVFITTVLAIPGFFSASSVRALLVLASLLGVASVGQTMTIVLGGLDLSIPGFIAFGSVMTALLGGRGWSFVAIVALVLGVGIIAGAANGLISRLSQAPSLIVTLATGSIMTGLALYLSKGSSGGQVPAWLTSSVSAGRSTLGVPLPPVVIAWLGLGIVSFVLERRAVLARRIYAAGASASAAHLASVPVTALWALAFAVSAVFASVAGVLLAGFSGGINATVGQPYLFLTVAAVVVGGNSLVGGRGSYVRTLAGAILITNLTTLLLGVGVNSNLQQILLGALIVAVVWIYGREAHTRDRI